MKGKSLLKSQNIYDNIRLDGRPDFTEIGRIIEEINRKSARYLENRRNTDGFAPPPEGDGPEMTTKIRRSITVDGKQHWIRANSEQEYAEKLLKLCASKCLTADIPDAGHDFAEYATTWYDLYSRPAVATATATTYKRQLTLHILPHFEGRTVESVTVDDVQRLFNSIDGSKATKEKVKMVLSMIFDAAVEDGLLKKNPTKSKRLKITGSASEPTEPYTVEEMRYIVQNIGRVKSPQDRAYIALMALHPLRLEEVLGLKWEDVDMAKMTIHVRRAVTHPTRNQLEVKETKTAASVRDIALTTTALQYLIPGEPGDFVCGGASPLSYSQVRRMGWHIEKDIEFDGKITPRRFRTTVLTDIYDQTKDVKQTQAAAGHTTSDMTFKHYVKGRGISSAITANVIDSVYNSLPC